MSAPERLARQLRFILEIDKAKQVLRKTVLSGDGRYENDAEHAWHVAVMAMLLAEYGPPGLDTPRLVRMLLVHDLVEIDAGDTYVYDDAGRAAQQVRERAAADRIFALLPDDQARELRGLWDEFECGRTPEAKFARAIDRLQPLLLGLHTRGVGWRRHGVSRDQVLAVNSVIGEAAPELWSHARTLIQEAVQRGDLAD